MRLSASRIRSINRAIARVQSSAWSVPDRNPHRYQPHTNQTKSVSSAEFVKVVVVPRGVTP